VDRRQRQRPAGRRRGRPGRRDVTLIGGGADGLIGSADDTSVSTVTGDQGDYQFTGLTPGVPYQLQFGPLPGAYVFTAPDANGNASDTLDSDVDPLTGKTHIVTLLSGEHDPTLDAGVYLPAAIGDRVWEDLNANGRQDDGEKGIAGVRVILRDCLNADAVVAETLTDSNGNYSFTALKPGQYKIEFVTPTGFVLTGRDAAIADDATDSDAAAGGLGGLTGCYTLNSGDTDTTVDAGFHREPSLPLEPGIEIVKDVVGTTFVAPNTPVTFNYSVKNTGGVPLGHIEVIDDNATPGFAADDFEPAPLLGANGRNVGDLNGDGLLDTTEIWQYSATVIPPVVMKATISGSTYDSGLLSYITLDNGDIRVFYRQSQDINDNQYAASGNPPGWNRTHTFGNLTGSDKAGFELRDANGALVMKFYMDYISGSSAQDRPTAADGSLLATGNEYSVYSGFRSLGVSGGDGSISLGSAAKLYDFDSTLELNLNRAGYTGATVNSPINDPNWDSVLGYYFTVKADAFGSAGFGGATIFDQHNSPPKVGSNSIIPEIIGGASVNTAVVTGSGGGTIVTDDDDATVIVVKGPLGSIGDRVWFDTNANGLQDDGPTGLGGVTVKLTADFNGDGNVDYQATTTTGANGLYSFTGLPAGTYTVALDPATLGGTTTQTYDLDGLATANTATTVLATGQHRTDVDFGYVGTTPGFGIDKTAGTANAAPGEPVTYTYKVSNTGSQALTNVLVKDDNGTPTIASDDFLPTRLADEIGNNDNVLDPGEVWAYSATVIPPTTLVATVNDATITAGTLLYSTLANGDIRVSYLQDLGVNDNTYGTGAAIDWPKGHTFGNLTGSDKLGVELKDANGQVVMKFYMDYISAASTQETPGEYAVYSGYRSLGVTGGDGKMALGSAANLYDFDSTLEENLNRAGYTGTTANSPIADPNWNAVMGYSFTVKSTVFGAAGFGGAHIFDQHNSPSKLGVNSIVTAPGTGEVTNVAVASAQLDGATVVAVDDATVVVGPQPAVNDATLGVGPVVAPSKFFVVDAGSDKTFGYGVGGQVNGSIGIDSGDARGITGLADGSKLWVLDKNKTVGMYEPDGTFLGSWTADGLGKEPEGIALDGQDMWVVDRGAKKLFWYEGAASNSHGVTDRPEWSFTLPSALDKPKGVTTDGTKLWIVEDDSADTVYRYTIVRDGSGKPTGLALDGTWTVAKPIENPTGITIDPTGVSNSLWIVDNKTDSVYEFAGGRDLTSGSGVAASGSFKLASGNTSPQDIFDPLLPDWLSAPGADAALDVTAAAMFDAIGDGRFDLVPQWLDNLQHALAGLPQTGPLPALGDLVTAEVSLDGLLGGFAPVAVAETAWFVGDDAAMAMLTQANALDRDDVQEYA
jgi:hypothetical protein